MGAVGQIQFTAFEAGGLRPIGRDKSGRDAHPARRFLTVPGATTVVPYELPGLLAVDEKRRRNGMDRPPVREAFQGLGTERPGLIPSDEASGFYGAFRHGERAGFGIYRDGG